MRILIVEDHFLVSEALRLTLVEAGHIVVAVASEASEAVRLAAEHSPDLALVDIQLAQGSNGIDAARAMEQDFAVPCFFVTSNPEAARLAGRVGLGCLTKPYTAEEVRAAVQAAEKILNGGEVDARGGFELY
ncbi:response regulator [Arenibaculum pallidiluteum]|uniref:response regulator n=1 Tax=Arenibaculum pallidiluteum TaxID=2812559 RepID=UPI001A96C220|nr:response regulator [Arenibaculum pallidiluteum]